MLFKDGKRFKSTQRTYLAEHVFYNLDEYYQITSQTPFLFLPYTLQLLGKKFCNYIMIHFCIITSIVFYAPIQIV